MTTESLKILIVDDDTDAADSLAELFEMDGHDVTVAYSGDEAINAYQSVNFDVAFMDIMMPGKNGVESFFEIRKLKPDAQVYMMTGYSVEQLVKQAVDHGALGVLSKPVDPRKVLAMLDDIKPCGIVLIAEDDPDYGPQLEEIIRSSGFRCKLVKSGDEALNSIARETVDIMILDLNLPVIDGIEVYTRLQDEGRAVPTIMITGHSCDQAVMRDMSVTGILNKPFDPSILLSKLKELAA